MRRQEARWVTFDTWVCGRHCPGARLPAAAKECWYNRCSKRPPLADRPAQVIEVRYDAVIKQDLCAWRSCESPSRERSKYCSRTCSNKNARERYRKKKEVA